MTNLGGHCHETLLEAFATASQARLARTPSASASGRGLAPTTGPGHDLSSYLMPSGTPFARDNLCRLLGWPF